MKRFGIVLGMLLVVAGCVRQDSPVAAGGPWGHTYLSTSASRELVGGTRIALRFADGRLGAGAGCSQMSANARIVQDRLLVGPFEMTAISCGPAADEQDAWLAEFLGARPTIRFNGPDLVLEAGGDRITLLDRELADPDRPLAGTTWTLDTLVSAHGAESIPDGVHAFLSFAANGTLSGSGGCDQLSGRYAAHDGEITFTDVDPASTTCTGSSVAVERQVLLVLTGTVHYEIEAGRLTLTGTGHNRLHLTADAVHPSPS